MKTGVDTSNEMERALVSLKSLLDAFQYIFSQKYNNFGFYIPLSSMQTVAPEGSSATKRFKEILLGSSKKTSFLKEPSCSIEILLGSSSLLRSTQLQNEDANQEQHAIQDEENEDNQESLFPGLKVVMFDEASTLMVIWCFRL